MKHKKLKVNRGSYKIRRKPGQNEIIPFDVIFKLESFGKIRVFAKDSEHACQIVMDISCKDILEYVTFQKPTVFMEALVVENTPEGVEIPL